MLRTLAQRRSPWPRLWNNGLRHGAGNRCGAAADALRRRNTRLTTRRAVQQAIVSVASLVGAPVYNQRGQRVGKLVDLVARIHGQDRYPPLTGLLLRVGSRTSFLPIEAVEHIGHQSVSLRTDRLDLRGEYVRQAIAAGVAIVCSTDAHSTRGLSNMAFSVATARRGWASAANIVNTRPATELRQIL